MKPVSAMAAQLKKETSTIPVASHSQLVQREEFCRAIDTHDHKVFDDTFASMEALFNLAANERAQKTIGEICLGTAMVACNTRAFNRLMFWSGHNHNSLTNGKYAPQTFITALQFGTLEMAQAIYKTNRSVINAKGSENQNLFQIITAEIMEEAVVRCGRFESGEIATEINKWYIGLVGSVTIPSSGLVVQFDGQIDKINWLFSLKANFWDADENGLTPYDIITNPEKHARAFDILGGSGLTFSKSEGHSVLTFAINLQCKLDRAKKIPMTVQYHFHELVAAFESAQKRREYDSRVASEEVLVLREEVKEHSEAINMGLRLRVSKVESCRQTLIVYNNVAKHLETMMRIYNDASTDFFTRNQQTGVEMAGAILEFIGSNTPSPFSLAFTVVGKIAQKVGYVLETERFKKISAVLPLGAQQLTELAQDVAVSAIDAFTSGFSSKSIPIEQFTEKEMTNLSKRIFTVAVYTLYKVDALEITNPSAIPSKTRAEMIKVKMLAAITTDKYVSEAVHAMESATLERIAKRSVDVDAESLRPGKVISFSGGHRVSASSGTGSSGLEEASDLSEGVGVNPNNEKDNKKCILM